MPTTILWFRRDLRLNDHPALNAAVDAADGGRVLPVFVGEPDLLDASTHRTWALISALRSLHTDLDQGLVYRQGDPREVIPSLAREVEAHSVHISAEPAPYGRRRDEAVATALREQDITLVATGSPYAIGPGLIRNGSGDPYKVFTPFSKAWREHGWASPAHTPSELRWYRQAESDRWPEPPAPAEGVELPQVGEAAARERWAEFRDEALAEYDGDRDRPDRDGTSRMSVQLEFGTVHPRTLLADLSGQRGTGAQTFRTELAWREFYADVLWHQPRSAWHDLRPALRGMTYDDPEAPEVAEAVTAWKQGRTGFPIVDAGMRQLRESGWMHNRVRMITASFLCKHLHVWWPLGARHFLEYLVDGDIASNNHGWQWVAGTGTDASPYFRVFNPVRQGQKFDPDGVYVRRWIPELRHLSGGDAHEPWKAGDGYRDGYPEPILDLADERAEALRRYESARS